MGAFILFYATCNFDLAFRDRTSWLSCCPYWWGICHLKMFGWTCICKNNNFWLLCLNIIAIFNYGINTNLTLTAIITSHSLLITPFIVFRIWNLFAYWSCSTQICAILQSRHRISLTNMLIITYITIFVIQR